MESSNTEKNQTVIASILGPQGTNPNTKAKILSAYLKVTVEEGSTELSLTKLAEEAGVSKQLVRYYIPNLNEAALELFKIMIQIAAGITQKEIEAAKTPEDQIAAWANATFDWLKSYPDFAQFVLFMYQRASVDDKVNELYSEHLQMGRKRILTVLKKFKKKKIQDNAAFYAKTLHQQMTATLVEMLALKDIAHQNKYRKDFFTFMDFLLKA